MIPNRPLRAAALAVIGLVLAGAPAAAATKTINMNESQDYSPSTLTIARGDTVRWRNNAVVTDHDVFGALPTGYISSPGGIGGMQPGEQYSKPFDSSGTFGFVCREHPGMAGTVIVPIKLQRVVVSGTVKFKVTVGVGTLPAGSPFRRRIQVDTPGGSTAFTDWKTVRNAVATYTPSAAGTYRFRSVLVRISNNTKSQPSPYRSVTK